MTILFVLLFIAVIFLIFTSNDEPTTFMGVIAGFILGLGLMEELLSSDSMKEIHIKEYISHPEKYNIEIKYKQGDTGTFYPCDTIITKLK